ncbi:MAG: 50S ribosomal protein L33 [Parcubacteria group bacterium 21-54-25]|nr:MAG: 50S ribosomal protein L33 [Parcubacteria group bacterium 21-54-25]HQU07918.1 50S ribosomal protein L33 [Candidatus Paceibacterota bacterium]
MSRGHFIKLRSTKSSYTYHTRKNRKKVERKIEFKKHNPTTCTHEAFTETKK